MAITVILSAGNISRQARMDERVPVERLIPAIVRALNLPITDNAGRPITYHLSYNGWHLQDNETLETAEVEEGGLLTIVPEMDAGDLPPTLIDEPRNITAPEVQTVIERTGTADPKIIAMIQGLEADIQREGRVDPGTFDLIQRLADAAIKYSTGKSRTKLFRSLDDEQFQLALKGSGKVLVPKAPEGIPPGFTLRAEVQEDVSQFVQIAWSPNGRYLTSSFRNGLVRLWEIDADNGVLPYRILRGHADATVRIAWSPNSQRLVSSSTDRSSLLWEVKTGRHLKTLADETEGRSARYIKSGRDIMPIGLPKQEVAIGTDLLQEPDDGSVTCVAWSQEEEMLATSAGEAIWVWNTKTQRRIHQLEHNDLITSLAWSPDGSILASSGNDGRVILWNTETWEPEHVLFPDQSSIDPINPINHIAWSPDSTMVAISSSNRTVSIWDSRDVYPLRILEGHTDDVVCASFSGDGLLFASQSVDGRILLWQTNTWEQVGQLQEDIASARTVGLAFHPRYPILANVSGRMIHLWQIDYAALTSIAGVRRKDPSVQYVNAKVVLVGDSGEGKTWLRLALTNKPLISTPSTHASHVIPFGDPEIVSYRGLREHREIFLWDLAGQEGYRLINQLCLDNVSTALLVFHPKKENDPFSGIMYWERSLRQAQQTQRDPALLLKRILVATKMDVPGTFANERQIELLINELSADGYHETSAWTGKNIQKLAEAIRLSIDWKGLPRVTSTVFFQDIKEFFQERIQHKSGRIISTKEDLYADFVGTRGDFQSAAGRYWQDERYKEFETCILHAERQGIVRRFRTDHKILLKPELLDAYALDLVNAAKKEPDGMGCIAEEQILNAQFLIHPQTRLPHAEDERSLLFELISDLLRWEIALREEINERIFLVFPSACIRDRSEQADDDMFAGKTIIFRFEGPVHTIYSRLVVRIAYCGSFKKKELWQNTATYTSDKGGTFGIALRNRGDGQGELTLFFDKDASEPMRYDFEQFVYIRLEQLALNNSIQRERLYSCPRCGEYPDNKAIRDRLEKGIKWVYCNYCDTETDEPVRIELLDGEERFKKKKVADDTPSALEEMEANAENQRKSAEQAIMLQAKIANNNFDVFFCYNAIDMPKVRLIGEFLKVLGILPYMEQWDDQPGTSRYQSQEKLIKECKTAAIFVGSNISPPWVTMRTAALLEQFVKRGCRVIPIILPDCQNTPELPVFLSTFAWVDFRETDPDPIKRLYWGITDIRL